MDLAISTALVPGGLEAKFASIAEAGFKCVELYEPDFAGSPAQARALANELGLRICLLLSFSDLECQTGAGKQQAFSRLERKFDLMHELGTDLLLFAAAVDPATVREDAAAIDDLGEAAERAGRRGLRLAWLALPWATHIKTDEHALRIVAAINSPHLGLALNSCLTLANGSKPAQLRDVPGSRVFHIQLADTVRSEAGISHHAPHFGLLPGQGELNLAGFVRIMARNGYRGPWSVACANEPSLGPAPARDGYRALVNLLDEISRADPEFSFDLPALPGRVHASGFEFIEFTADHASGGELAELLAAMCFRLERRHVSKAVELWRQGAINILINTETEGSARSSFVGHGPSVCDMGLRVKDARQTVARAAALGSPTFWQPVRTGELDIPAIRGVGGSVMHFIDEQSDLHRLWDIEFALDDAGLANAVGPAGLRRIDHLAQTMPGAEMRSWLLYYLSTFEMQKSPIIDITDPSGVVHSQALESPEGEIRLNLNGAEGKHTLAASFLADQLGAGVQHIAFATDDIFETSARLDDAGFTRLDIAQDYYADTQAAFELDDRLVKQLEQGRILYDRQGGAEYFQIYSKLIFQDFFFEIVERRRGYAGYGMRNAAVRLAAQARHRRTAAPAEAN